MDFNGMVQALQTNVTPVIVTLFVLLVISEVLGSMESVKANSIYQVVKTFLLSVKEKVFPTMPPVLTKQEINVLNKLLKKINR